MPIHPSVDEGMERGHSIKWTPVFARHGSDGQVEFCTGDIDSPKASFMVQLDPHGRVAVKRDMELVREILLSVQDRPDMAAKPVELDGYEHHVLDRHVEMLVEAGLLIGRRQPTGRSFSGEMAVTDMSWAGHDFLAALDNKTVWGRFKKAFTAAEIASMPFEVLKDVGVAALKEWARNKMGLSV